nr:hypothetical protein [Tanacetum cinerariifolium]
VGAIVGRDKVGFAVGVHVGHRNIVGHAAGAGRGGSHGLEGTRAVAQQHAHGAASVIAGNDVALAVVI